MQQQRDQSFQLAQFWLEMHTIQKQIDTVILPLAYHLGIAQEAPEVVESLADCSEGIKHHFLERFKLQASLLGK